MSIEEDSLFVETYDNLVLIFKHINKLNNTVNYYTISIEFYSEIKLTLQNLGLVNEKQKNQALKSESYEITYVSLKEINSPPVADQTLFLFRRFTTVILFIPSLLGAMSEGVILHNY